LYLKANTSLFNGKNRLLHIAPEYCFIDRFEKLEHLDYLTADIESPLARVKMDIHQIPFDENSFDCVLCNHVLEHVENDKIAIKEILRVLKPGGWAILQVPFFPPIPELTLEDPSIQSPKDRFKKYGQEDHLRLYGHDFRQRLESCGFNVTEDQYLKSLPPEKVKRHALVNETIYFCTKPPV
jgi:SAM-dependent methyltransferase